uniref:Uncharacterized protein n=1 Tax=Anguilla anguilla TaxID=7936 RepID=A0A0E9WQC8_ANGAN
MPCGAFWESLVVVQGEGEWLELQLYTVDSTVYFRASVREES